MMEKEALADVLKAIDLAWKAAQSTKWDDQECSAGVSLAQVQFRKEIKRQALRPIHDAALRAKARISIDKRRNASVCSECGVDDFTHTEGCTIGNFLEPKKGASP